MVQMTQTGMMMFQKCSGLPTIMTLTGINIQMTSDQILALGRLIMEKVMVPGQEKVMMGSS